jgi:hypothetical protein
VLGVSAPVALGYLTIALLANQLVDPGPHRGGAALVAAGRDCGVDQIEVLVWDAHRYLC